LPALEIVYHTYGKLNAAKNNVVWVCHALTANSDCADWWDKLIGEGKTIDPKNYFIVCANIIGSCYGSTGPLTINPVTGNKYHHTFPLVTIRDMVNAHILLRKELGIDKINIGIAGSMGAYQLMEWAYSEKQLFDNLVMLTTSARESAWGIAIHTAQRLAIEADCTWKTSSDNAGSNGLKAARAIGMLTYRNYEAFGRTQTDNEDKIDNYKASSYINYQGNKLANRFNAYSYWLLSKAMDSHNTARNRGKMEEILKQITTRTLLIGIASDLLCPVAEQQYLAQHLGNAVYHEIDSPFGHDGFLIEGEKVGKLFQDFLQQH
jgi:homoserine O-acetyltransferase/O-succinyltransferase